MVGELQGVVSLVLSQLSAKRLKHNRLIAIICQILFFKFAWRRWSCKMIVFKVFFSMYCHLNVWNDSQASVTWYKTRSLRSHVRTKAIVRSKCFFLLLNY